MQPSGAPAVTVRPATPADLPRLGRLGALLVEAHYNLDAQRFLAARPRTPADYAAFLTLQLDRPDVAVLVADESGDVIGYAYATVGGYDYMALCGPASCTTSSSTRGTAAAASADCCSTPPWPS